MAFWDEGSEGSDQGDESSDDEADGDDEADEEGVVEAAPYTGEEWQDEEDGPDD